MGVVAIQVYPCVRFVAEVVVSGLEVCGGRYRSGARIGGGIGIGGLPRILAIFRRLHYTDGGPGVVAESYVDQA